MSGAKVDIAHHHGRHVVSRREARGRKWGHLEFNFKTPKAAYGFARLLLFGKEIGLVPDTIEIRYDAPRHVLIGHWVPK